MVYTRMSILKPLHLKAELSRCFEYEVDWFPLHTDDAVCKKRKYCPSESAIDVSLPELCQASGHSRGRHLYFPLTHSNSHLPCFSKNPLPSLGDSASLGSRWAGFVADSKQHLSSTSLVQTEPWVLSSRLSAHRMARGLCNAGQHTMGRQEYRSSVSMPRHFPASGIIGGLRKCLTNHINFLKSSDQITEMLSVFSTEERLKGSGGKGSL